VLCFSTISMDVYSVRGNEELVEMGCIKYCLL
jgi:hypothetical protein